MPDLPTPRLDYLIVKTIVTNDVTDGGIIVTEKDERKDTLTGEVLAVGPGRAGSDGVLIEPDIAPGDRVIFMAQNEIQLDGFRDVHLVQSEVVVATL